MWSLERGVSCTAERGSGRIRSGRICTLACLILSRKTKRENDQVMEKKKHRRGGKCEREQKKTGETEQMNYKLNKWRAG